MDSITSWLEKKLGTVKFAVIIVLVFAIYLIYGTFVESWYGADYAGRLIYKSLPFMLVQVLMFLSIFFATTKRFPLKKRLHGFYVLHLGILILFLGSFVTYWVGIDGNLTLAPNESGREVILNEDRLRVLVHDKNKEFALLLPYRAGIKELNRKIEGITFKDYLPFAKKVVEWKKSSAPTQSSEYLLANENFGETIIMSTHANSPFETSTRLGLLNIHYMPGTLFSCFQKPNPFGVLIFNARNGECAASGEKGVTTGITKSNKRRFVIFKINSERLKFFPDFSPMPVKDDLSIVQESPWRAFSKSLFEKSPHLFLFGDALAYFDKSEEKWVTQKFKEKEKIALPWMGFEIKLKKNSLNQYPHHAYVYTKPIMDGGQIVQGGSKAINIEVKGERYQVNNEKKLTLLIDGKKVSLFIDKKTIKLPFELTLKNFKMAKDPGTSSPASYESYVDLFSDGISSNHHIFMNNPLKYDAFTFYQASYFDAGGGHFGSVLSVNLDPGRPLKYLGSLLLVLGSIWHFGLMAIRQKRRTAP